MRQKVKGEDRTVRDEETERDETHLVRQGGYKQQGARASRGPINSG